MCDLTPALVFFIFCNEKKKKIPLTPQGKELVLSGHTASVDQLKWDPTHVSRLATVSMDKTVRFWDARCTLLSSLSSHYCLFF